MTAVTEGPTSADEMERFNELLPVARSIARKYENLYRRAPGEFITAAYMGAWKAAKSYNGTGHLRPWGVIKITGAIIDSARDEMRSNGQGRREESRFVTLSLDLPLNYTDYSGGGEPATMGSAMPCPRSDRGYEQIEDHDLLMHLRARMDPREWDVMTRCLCNEERQKDVGASYGVTESRCNQILKRALIHARNIIVAMVEAGPASQEDLGIARDAIAEAHWIGTLRAAQTGA